MISTTVELANHALTAIGADRISSLTETSEAARSANLFYEQARDIVLRSHPFTAAKRRAELAAVSDDGLSNYDYKFSLPGGCLRIVKLFDSTGDDYVELTDYDREGGHIRCDKASVLCEYLTNNIEVEGMPDYLSIAISYKLASMMAFRLTAGLSVKNAMDQEYAMALSQAKVADGFQEPWRGARDTWDPYDTDASTY